MLNNRGKAAQEEGQGMSRPTHDVGGDPHEVLSLKPAELPSQQEPNLYRLIRRSSPLQIPPRLSGTH